jgi:hypothetical protein
MEPKEFMAQIDQLLDAVQQPVLEDFLMRNLSFLRDCLTTGELSFGSILTHSTGKPYIAEAVKVSCQETTGQTCSIQQGPTAQGCWYPALSRVCQAFFTGTQPKVIHPAISQAKGIRAAIFQPKVIRPAIFQPRVIRPALSQPSSLSLKIF